MASTTSSNPYVFQRASTMAIRSLVSGSKPGEIPSTSSNDASTQAKQMLQRKTTDHYEQAAAAATKAGDMPATTAGSVVASVIDRPGAARQQSLKMSDFKAQQQGQMLSGRTTEHGYSSTQK